MISALSDVRSAWVVMLIESTCDMISSTDAGGTPEGTVSPAA